MDQPATRPAHSLDPLHDGEGHAPDLIEAVIGWRAWTVERNPRGMLDRGTGRIRVRLHSLFHESVWNDGLLEWDGTCWCDVSIQAEQAADDLVLEADQLLYPLYGGPPLDVATLPAWLQEIVAAEPDLERAHEIAQAHIHRVRHPLDHPLCKCGINAFIDLETLRSYRYDTSLKVQAVGEIQLTGRVRVFERGYRASCGRASRVWATQAHSAPLVRLACEQAGIEYMGLLDQPAG